MKMLFCAIKLRISYEKPIYIATFFKETPLI